LKRISLIILSLAVLSCGPESENKHFPSDNKARTIVNKKYDKLEKLAELMLSDNYRKYSFGENRTYVALDLESPSVVYDGPNKDKYIELYEHLKVWRGSVINGDVYFFAGAVGGYKISGVYERKYALDTIRYFKGSPKETCTVESFTKAEGACQTHIKNNWYLQYIWLDRI